MALFRAILDRWSAMVEERGGRFLVAIVPSGSAELSTKLFAGYQVLDLRAGFQQQGFDGTSWRFVNDGHWNELENQLAALHLYRHLESSLSLEILSEEEILRQLTVYYRSFSDMRRSELWIDGVEVPEDRARAIRRRYLPLERAPAARAAKGSTAARR